MATLFRCVQGHHWEDTFGGPTILDGEYRCPECGLPSYALAPSDDHAHATEAYPPVPIPGIPTSLLPQVPGAPATAVRSALANAPAEDAPSAPSRRLPRSRGSDTKPRPELGGRPTPNIPGYEILGELGRGGMGVVYKARQVGLNRMVAIKMILSGSAADERERGRFKTEGEAIARLAHPNIVQVFEIGEHEGSPWFSLEFVDGGSLADRLKGEPLAVNESAQLIEVLGGAMYFAHEHGVVHRDIKPANVLLHREEAPPKAASGSREQKKVSDPSLVSPRTVPKITDFGLAKTDEDIHHTRSGMVVGTPSYMAPEQATQGSTVGPQTDIWALGVILYQMVTGRLPFIGDTAMEIMIKLTQEEPPPPSRYLPKLPRDLETIILKCLEKEPERRYATAQDLSDDLKRFLAHEPILARPVGRVEHVLRWARRHKAVASLGVIGTLAVASLLVTLGVMATTEGRRKAAVRGKVSAAIQRAEAKAEAREWAAVPAILDEARRDAAGEPSLRDLDEQINKLSTQAADENAARATFDEFSKRRADAIFRAAQDTAAPTRQQLDKTLEVLAEALATVGASPTKPQALPGAYTDDEKSEIERGCYELVLMYASSLARKPVEEPKVDPARLAEALAVLDRAKEMGFRTPAYHLRRARVLAVAGKPDEAAHERKLANTVKAGNDLDFYLLGLEYLLSEERLDDAESAFYSAQRLNPQHYWATYFLAVCHIRQGLFTAARDNLSACLAMRPNEVRTLVMRAYVQGRLGLYADAEQDFSAAMNHLATRRDDAEMYALLNNRAVTRLSQGKYADAAADLNQAEKLTQEGYHVFVTRADLLEKQNKSAEALEQMNAAIERAKALKARGLAEDGDLAQLYQARYVMLVKAKRSAEALADLDQMLKLGAALPPGRMAKLNRDRGHAHQRAGDWDKALESYNEAAKLDPKSAETQRWRGDVLARLGKPREAVEAYDAYRKLGGAANKDVLRVRAASLMMMHQYERAALAYTAALELSPKDRKLLAQRGRAHLASKAWEPAARDFDAVISGGPTAEAHLGRGQARLRLNKASEAVEDARAAAKLGEGDAKALQAASMLLTQAALQLDPASRRQREASLIQALSLLEQSMKTLSEAERPAAWRAAIALPALRPLREAPGFSRVSRLFMSLEPR